MWNAVSVNDFIIALLHQQLPNPVKVHTYIYVSTAKLPVYIISSPPKWFAMPYAWRLQSSALPDPPTRILIYTTFFFSFCPLRVRNSRLDFGSFLAEATQEWKSSATRLNSTPKTFLTSSPTSRSTSCRVSNLSFFGILHQRVRRTRTNCKARHPPLSFFFFKILMTLTFRRFSELNFLLSPWWKNNKFRHFLSWGKNLFSCHFLCWRLRNSSQIPQIFIFWISRLVFCTFDVEVFSFSGPCYWFYHCRGGKNLYPIVLIFPSFNSKGVIWDETL